VDAFFGFADLALVFFGMGNILVVDSSNINELLAVSDWLLAFGFVLSSQRRSVRQWANRKQITAKSRFSTQNTL
jgi:hypothetical protein